MRLCLLLAGEINDTKKMVIRELKIDIVRFVVKTKRLRAAFAFYFFCSELKLRNQDELVQINLNEVAIFRKINFLSNNNNF